MRITPATHAVLARMTAGGASASPAATAAPTVTAPVPAPVAATGGPTPPATPSTGGGSGGGGTARLVLRVVGGGNISGTVNGEELDGIPPYDYPVGSLVDLAFIPRLARKISCIKKDGVVVETQRTMTFLLEKTTVISVEFELKSLLKKKVEDIVTDPGVQMLRELNRPSPAIFALFGLIAAAMLLLWYFQRSDNERSTRSTQATVAHSEAPNTSDQSAPSSDCPTRQVGAVTVYDGTKGACSFTASDKLNWAVEGKFHLKEGSVKVWHSQISCDDFRYHDGPNSEMRTGQTTPWPCTSVVAMKGQVGSYTLTTN